MNEYERDISRVRNNIALFMLSSVVFGVVLGFLSWSISQILPSWVRAEYVLVLSILSLLLLGYVAFRLIIPPMKIDYAVDCYLMQSMKTGDLLTPITMYYPFSFVAANAFQELGKALPEYKDLLKQPLDLQGVPIKHFMLYSILAWLSKLPAATVFAAYRITVPRPPRIYQDPKEKMQTVHHTLYARNLSNIFVGVPSLRESLVSHLTLPRSMRLDIKDDKVTLRNRYLRIEISYQAYQWFRGLDARLLNILAIGKEEMESYGSVSAVIRFQASLSAPWTLLPKANVYWNFAIDVLENMRVEYSWTTMMNDMKEWLTWETLSESGAKHLR